MISERVIYVNDPQGFYSGVMRTFETHKQSEKEIKKHQHDILKNIKEKSNSSRDSTLHKPLLEITIDDINSTPRIKHNGKEIEALEILFLNWGTATDSSEGNFQYNIESIERNIKTSIQQKRIGRPLKECNDNG